MKQVALVVGTLLMLAPMAVNAQAVTAGGNYKGTFGDGQTTATLQARVLGVDLNVTFEVSSRGSDGSKYNQAFAYNNVDGWSTRARKAIPRYIMAVDQANHAYGELRKRVQISLNDKLGTNRVRVALPNSPFPISTSEVKPDPERINIH